MWETILAGLKVVGQILGLVERAQDKADTAEKEAVGAAKQANTNLAQAVKTKDKQLQEAAKPDMTRDEIIADGEKRKR
jgi:hypothetical protein